MQNLSHANIITTVIYLLCIHMLAEIMKAYQFIFLYK